MVQEATHDFLQWTSFPSSIKLYNTEKERFYRQLVPIEPAPRGLPVRVVVKAKQEVVSYMPSGVWINVAKPYVKGIDPQLDFPLGSFDWTEFEKTWMIPVDADAIAIGIRCGTGTTWFDDLKIYQNDALIYSNDFSNWDPVIGAGIGAPIGGAIGYFIKEPLGPMVSEAVGAVLGGALGGGVGLLTGLGIIPVPQIPALEAAPEGPGVPARLGKYLVTG